MIIKQYALLGCMFFFLSAHQDSLSSFKMLVDRSAHFHAKNHFPTQNNRIHSLAKNDVKKKRIIIEQACNTRPILHGNVLVLIKKFLNYKKTMGSYSEKKLYRNMDEYAFIDRLLCKRPLMFMTEKDLYLLHTKEKGQGGFETVGTEHEYAPLVLADYLSYDEMQISALIGISSPTFFINNGSRYNRALPASPGTYQECGIYIGLVGARFEKPGLMEWQHIIITLQSNKSKTPLLALWEDFYNESFITFEEAQKDISGRYLKLTDSTYFDTVIYKKRMRLVIEPFLAEANERAKKSSKKAYCHVVGLGLGVWQKSPQQEQLLLDVYQEILNDSYFPHIADIDFSWFSKQSKITTSQPIKIHFSQRNPADKLTGNDADKLLIAMYAWDSNAYPGNEYWDGALTASGDPAAACCSTIAELQNPLINHYLTSKNAFITVEKLISK